MNACDDPQIDLAVASTLGTLSAETRLTMIAESAYFRAQARGFTPGFELDDWLDAELEVDDRLAEHGLAVV